MEMKLLQFLQNCKQIRELNQIQLQIIIHGLHNDEFILSKLVKLSSNIHSLDYAIQIFETSQAQSILVYNNLIKCCNDSKRQQDAFSVFKRMKEDTTTSPNSFTFTFILKSANSPLHFELGTQIHAQILKSGYGFHLFVQNTLLDVYSKCSAELDLLRRLFDEMAERDVVSWNSMIAAYMTRGNADMAIKLFESMPERNTVSWNSIITGLSKSGYMELAGSVFERMPVRNTASCNAMITGYVRQGDLDSAWKIFNRMQVKDVISWTAMISGYSHIGDLVTAGNLFAQMPIKNVISWNALIAGNVQNHQFDKALHMLHQMLLEGEFKPDNATLLSVLSACAHLGAHEQGKWIVEYINKNKFDLTTSLGNAIIDMYAKCGNVENAKSVFSQMKKKCIITWTSMVSGLAINGECIQALKLFDAMCGEKMEPDDVMFLTVLSACTHGGLVEEGKRVFEQMLRDFKIKPRIEHYGCMVDLLSRAGKLEEAVEFIGMMPIEPNAVIWATLLGSCKVYGNRELVEYASKKILDLEPPNSGYRVLISNSNAVTGQWENVSKIWTEMREEGIEKVPGCSSIQVGNRVHEFLAKDTRHKQRKKIYETLDGLSLHLKALGYVPFTTQYGLFYQ
ncbi:pentatricopeptide repeat-containing protein At1g08070, chloroplastic-like [Aristolochia californica]|uniref:pentatricopeptide repeat-containing protein At1g08070, chloroplastic-like n=1 Tax=Aristolochia californica TaxID=171875 RepID=UPI0035DEBBCE